MNDKQRHWVRGWYGEETFDTPTDMRVLDVMKCDPKVADNYFVVAVLECGQVLTFYMRQQVVQGEMLSALGSAVVRATPVYDRKE